MNQPTRSEQERLVKEWNAQHRIGTSVTVFHTTRRDSIRAETTTRSQSFVSDAGIAVVFLAGIGGYWSLECVVPRPAERAHASERTPTELALYEAVKSALDRQQTDADFGYYAGYLTATFELLVKAEAAFLSESVELVEERRRKQEWRRDPEVLELRKRLEETEA